MIIIGVLHSRYQERTSSGPFCIWVVKATIFLYISSARKAYLDAPFFSSHPSLISAAIFLQIKED